MSLGELPDLGKIGKRIGRRLRDILNPPVDDGHSKEERLAKRLQDSLKGLVYFDNFDEIEDWKVENVDPVQQANTPLLVRSASHTYDQDGPTSRLMLCHDYSGGYHDWEGIRPTPIPKKPYSCKYFQFVEFFIYFSHKSVAIPPASWINSCHRNGVKILGTFIVEGDGKAKSIGRMFDQLDGEYVVARRLAEMARAYGFDGWLLNIESEFPYAVQHPVSNLTAFTRSLKRYLGPNGTVVWYDAITKDNEVDYQNALTWKNVEFGLAADLFFTNYKWNIPELHKSMAVAEQHGINLAEVYFGIDCWAQNTNMPGPPRITYPPKGGGGTLTGLATHVLAQNGFSTAIFGPAWPYEHFVGPSGTSSLTKADNKMPGTPHQDKINIEECEMIGSEAEAVELSMWEGARLPDRLSCNCKPGHPHHRSGYRSIPIIRAAREYPAGTSSYLETDFRPAFGLVSVENVYTLGVGNVSPTDHDLTKPSVHNGPWKSTLGYQATFPSVSHKQQDTSKPALNAEVMCDGSSRLHVCLIPPTTKDDFPSNEISQAQPPIAHLCLFKLDLATNVGLVARVHFQMFSMKTQHLVAGIYTKAATQDSQELKDTQYELFSPQNLESHDAIFNLKITEARSRIVEIGLYCKSLQLDPKPIHFLDLYSLVIKPIIASQNEYFIEGLETYHRSSGIDSEQRLRWRWRGSKDGWPSGVPWSETTGPFSIFTVLAGGEELGQAHCLEFPLRADDFADARGDERELVVKGRLFGGGEVFSAPRVVLASD